MAVRLLIILSLINAVIGQRYSCSEQSVSRLIKWPTYEFSTKILDRVAQNNDAHFVFSPLSTWLQLSALAEGAKGRTLRELWNVTRHHRNRCFKSKLRRMLRKQSRGLKDEYRRKSVIVIDKVMGVKKRFIKDVLQFYSVKVMLKDFDYPELSANEVNNFIQRGTNGIINESVYSDDFDDGVTKEKTMMLLSDNVVFRSAWKFPFNTAYTKIESFKTSSGVHFGNVNMMSMTGYFYMTEMRLINARVLEIPCISNFSMLLLIPLKESWIGDTFYRMKRTTLSSIFNRFKAEGKKLVNIKLPRFRISSSVDNLAELLFDMGVKRIFDPNLSDFSHISKYTLHASLMTQVADIEVTEQGVRVNASAEFLINDTTEKFKYIADRPFGYMIVDRHTEFILFAGTYSYPSVY